MRFKLFMGAAMVCALALAQLAPAAGAATKGVYKGKTAQKRNVVLAVRGNGTIEMLRFKAELKCRNGVRLIVAESGFVPTRLRAGGRFRDVQVGRTDEVRFRGRASGRKVRGKIRVTDRLRRGGPRCVSPWLGFQAVRR